MDGWDGMGLVGLDWIGMGLGGKHFVFCTKLEHGVTWLF